MVDMASAEKRHDTSGEHPEHEPVQPAIPGSRSAGDPDRQLPRGRHDLPREFVARSQRERLLDAMAHTVAAKGYGGASLSEVCAAAGVSTRAFYEHFSDKESCFLAAFDLGARVLRRRLRAAYETGGDWPGRMRAGLAELLTVLAGEPTFAALAVVEVMAAGPRALQWRAGLLASFRPYFAEAPCSRDQPEAPAGTAAAVICGVYGVIFDHVSTGRTDELPDRTEELTYVILAPFVGRRVARAVAGLPDREG